ncbi:hypothetical protein Ade02nite_34810 [Paractinoplanes deccanensis]|uniref:RNA polymerase sigma-70 region 4 domain-containing protein n=1 Tax=Paractinoplanes deccanensis TaxID=113561 RepID=A0ABQ3Y4F5_9ACTN|nr:hypothetical protein Ade02nite_34810 [Actinoplanes deccanensis]
MLRHLSDPHREIIVATFFGRRTTGEAAELLGLAPEEAKARLYEAMRALTSMVATCPCRRPGPVPRRSPVSFASVWRAARTSAPGRGGRRPSW